jgi:hypothetical protein
VERRLNSERRRQTNREWQQRMYWSDSAYRERRLSASADWRRRNPDKAFIKDQRSAARRRLAHLAELGVELPSLDAA